MRIADLLYVVHSAGIGDTVTLKIDSLASSGAGMLFIQHL
jgi:hypothetical protein